MEFPFNQLRFRTVDGIPDLILVIAQDSKTEELLMVAFANREAIEKTLETGKAHYFSTSRKKIWLKGETSGHVQYVEEILVDCDGDALLYRVKQEGGACHKGYKSCFFRRFKDGRFEICSAELFEPEKVYKEK